MTLVFQAVIHLLKLGSASAKWAELHKEEGCFKKTKEEDSGKSQTKAATE